MNNTANFLDFNSSKRRFKISKSRSASEVYGPLTIHIEKVVLFDDDEPIASGEEGRSGICTSR